MQTIDLQRKFDLTAAEVEVYRELFGGTFHHMTGRNFRKDNGVWSWEQTSDWQTDHNIVTNQGLDHVLTIVLDATTNAIGTWHVLGVKSNTAEAAGMTYAVPTFTEITGSDVTEGSRVAWANGSVSGQSITNPTAATYTANASFTMFGAALAGNPAATATFGDTAAANGILYAYSLFASSKAMTASDTIDITYTFTSADDGV